MGACCSTPNAAPSLPGGGEALRGAGKLAANENENDLVLEKLHVLLSVSNNEQQKQQQRQQQKACCDCTCSCASKTYPNATLYLFPEHITLTSDVLPNIQIKLFKPGFRLVFNDEDTASPTGMSLLFLPSNVLVFPSAQSLMQCQEWIYSIERIVTDKNNRGKQVLQGAKDAALVVIARPEVKRAAATVVAGVLAVTVGPVTSAVATPLVVSVGFQQANKALLA